MHYNLVVFVDPNRSSLEEAMAPMGESLLGEGFEDDDTIHRCGVRWGSDDDPCFDTEEE